MDDVTTSLGKAFENEYPGKVGKVEDELDHVESHIKEKLAAKWDELVRLAEFVPGEHDTRRRAFILLYAHFLRVPVQNATLQKGMFVLARPIGVTLINWRSRANCSSLANTCALELNTEHHHVTELAPPDYRRYASACLHHTSSSPQQGRPEGCPASWHPTVQRRLALQVRVW